MTKHIGENTSSAVTLPTHYTLNSGDKIPSVALGVWKASPGNVGQAVKVALGAGYTHIDGAWIYGNEKEVGEAIRESGVAREDIWVTSKLWNTFHYPEDVERGLDESLGKLGLDYLDLYLVHWPVAFKKDGTPYDEELTAEPFPTWQKLEEMVEKGKVRNIGISNFNARRIEALLSHPDLKIKPAVLQVELSYWNPQSELITLAKSYGIAVEAYSPLGGDGMVGKTLSLPVVKHIAAKTGLTPAQVVISWHVQRGTVVLPKSVTPSRIEENLQVHALPQDLFDELEAAANAHEPFRTINPSQAWGLDFDVFDD
ncbi:Aldo/keto reductase [Fistulina hepatica ATCC 64428]|uniref:Aldo/keto reductase n=1 Tax=Fistulina hepatica ATCC 64428 TaxID=1128425 RepID=A0A0D7AL09_9AGAR|nr:Aldo/keto reductase [Fistulina hepatica ATCC 64428]